MSGRKRASSGASKDESTKSTPIVKETPGYKFYKASEQAMKPKPKVSEIKEAWCSLSDEERQMYEQKSETEVPPNETDLKKSEEEEMDMETEPADEEKADPDTNGGGGEVEPEIKRVKSTDPSDETAAAPASAAKDRHTGKGKGKTIGIDDAAVKSTEGVGMETRSTLNKTSQE